MFETFDHTADLGLRARAATIDLLFAQAAEALFTVLIEDLSTVRQTELTEFSVQGADREYLLFDWLKSLLYEFDGRHRLFSRFAVRLGPDGLTGQAWGEPLDWERHVLSHEVKAITYHGLKVQQLADGEWLAEVIVDI